MTKKTFTKVAKLRPLMLAGAFLALCLLTGVVTTYGSIQGPPVPVPKPGYFVEAGLRGLVPASPLSAPRLVSGSLDGDDAARYGHIFAFQDTGDWVRADEEIAKLSDRRLMGHVLSQRYLHPDYKASYAELAGWMRVYADHPGADRVYKLAVRRKPAGSADPARPRVAAGTAGRLDIDAGQASMPYVPPKVRPAAERARARDIEKAVRRDLSSDRPSAALKRLTSAEAEKVFDAAERDYLMGDIAASYFFLGKPELAYETARPAVERSGAQAPMAGWIAGLMAWKSGDYARAAQYFEKVAESQRVSAWMDSAGAFWAARAHLRNKNTREVSRWLKEAARHPRSFYGLLALKTLGVRRGYYNWDVPEFGSRHKKALLAVPAGNRALALLEARQYALAEEELSRINARNDKTLREALVALAGERGFPSLAMQIGSAVTDEDGGFYDAVLYPESPWEPENGWSVDRALVFALIRQESRFDPSVSNRGSGAVGLMQLMPSTASHILGLGRGHFTNKNGKARLTDPAFNMELGQRYLKILLGLEMINGDLFKMTVAYNAGPGKLQRWLRQLDYQDDPLLFVESIPVAETRMFVEKVMANYWIYRMRMGQETKSLEQAAAGEWPVYRDLDGKGLLRMASLDW